MTLAEARQECQDWLDHLRSTERRATRMQYAARLAREGKWAKAKKIQREIDSQPHVYDGAKLRDAVIVLLDETEGRS